MNPKDAEEDQTDRVARTAAAKLSDLHQHRIFFIVDQKHEILVEFFIDQQDDHSNQKDGHNRKPDAFIIHWYFPGKKAGEHVSHDQPMKQKLMIGKEIMKRQIDSRRIDQRHDRSRQKDDQQHLADKSSLFKQGIDHD